MDFTEEYTKILTAGGQLLVVLQSDPAKLALQPTLKDTPFEIICDPKQKLYQEFAIEPAASPEAMKGKSSLAKMARVQVSHLVHGEYEGNELQLPATFVVDHEMTVVYAHYGCDITDVPTTDKLVKLL